MHIWFQWLTCIMTSRMRAGVKILLSSIENVWGIYTPPDENVCNLWSIVAVTALLANIDDSWIAYCLSRFLSATDAETETEVRKWKYGSEKKSRLSVPSLRMCRVGKGWLSLSNVRAEHWHIGVQRALAQSFSMTCECSLVLVSVRDYLLVSLG